MEPSKKLKAKNNSDYDYFYEEIEARNTTSSYDLPDNFDASGLSQENVHKITEDIFNPMPSDTDS